MNNLLLACVASQSMKRKFPVIVKFWKKGYSDLEKLVDLHSFFFFFYKNVVFPTQAEYSYFSADFRLKIFFYYS